MDIGSRINKFQHLCGECVVCACEKTSSCDWKCVDSRRRRRRQNKTEKRNPWIPFSKWIPCYLKREMRFGPAKMMWKIWFNPIYYLLLTLAVCVWCAVSSGAPPDIFTRTNICHKITTTATVLLIPNKFRFRSLPTCLRCIISQIRLHLPWAVCCWWFECRVHKQPTLKINYKCLSNTYFVNFFFFCCFRVVSTNWKYVLVRLCGS